MTTLDAALRRVFFLEGLTSLLSGTFMFVFPAMAIAQLGNTAPVASDLLLLQWFASLVVLLGYIGVFFEPTHVVIEGLLLGDLLWLIVGKQLLDLWNPVRWTGGAHFSFWITVFLAIARSVFLLRVGSAPAARPPAPATVPPRLPTTAATRSRSRSRSAASKRN